MISRYKNPYGGIVKDVEGVIHPHCPHCGGRWVTTDSIHCENHDDVYPNNKYCIQTFTGAPLDKDTYVFALALKGQSKGQDIIYSVVWNIDGCAIASRTSVHVPWPDREKINAHVPYDVTFDKLKLYFVML